mgnify:FL=1
MPIFCDRIGRSTYPRLEYMIAKGIRTIHAHIFHISVIAVYIVPRYADRYMRSIYLVPESFSDLRICDWIEKYFHVFVKVRIYRDQIF